jgi:hypothetical protein
MKIIVVIALLLALAFPQSQSVETTAVGCELAYCNTSTDYFDFSACDCLPNECVKKECIEENTYFD